MLGERYDPLRPVNEYDGEGQLGSRKKSFDLMKPPKQQKDR
jgi:hypothetical protein